MEKWQYGMAIAAALWLKLPTFVQKQKIIGALVAFKTWLGKTFHKVVNVKSCLKPSFFSCPVFLVINNSINRLRLHQFLGTKTTEANKSTKTDANRAYYCF